MFKKIKTLLLASFLVGVVASGLVGPVVYADPYGQGNYSQCEYQTGCPEPTTTNPSSGSGSGNTGTTVVPTKTQLEVAINIVDGQVIPYKGYTVTITPLNTSESSVGIERVEFYLDGQLISNFQPDSTGTATWFWDVSRYQGTSVKIIVYLTDGEKIEKTFTIKTESAPEIAAPTDNGTPTTPNVGVDTAGSIILPLAISIAISLLVLGLLFLFWKRRRKQASGSNMPTQWPQ